MALRNFSSTAAQTTLSAGVTSASTTLMVAATTGFPPAPFILAVNAGASAQELVLVTAVAGTNLTVTRGYDSTVASAHDAGAVIQHSHAALDFREANTHVNATTNVHGLGVGSAVVGTTDAQALTNKTVALGSNTVSGTRAQFNAAMTDDDFATLGGAETLTNKTFAAPSATGSLANFGGAWTAYSPAWTASGTAPTIGNGTLTGRYSQIGKTVHFTINFVVGSTSAMGTGAWYWSLPVAPATVVLTMIGQAYLEDAGLLGYNALARVETGSKVQLLYQASGATSHSGVTPTAPFTWATGDVIRISGTYEAA